MKQILLVFSLFLAFGFHANSQAVTPPANSSDNPVARATTEQLKTKYNLSADQAKQMYTIQVRKLRNFSEIESLKTTNPAKYLAKVTSVQNGTLGSIKRLLNNKDQVQLFQKTQSEVRAAKAVKRKELYSKGLEKKAIEAELLNIYAE
jgi:hypothetical protein